MSVVGVLMAYTGNIKADLELYTVFRGYSTFELITENTFIERFFIMI